ncbi:hypothetical protein RBU61_08355 [Tissierella sp. MB52-C2]|uniref:hypothetical protein n=1 Tax=Tissierella sp. MB52-C2 TaxID=3070999 RepID=UPI00280AD3D7|nr:hypothetical protein [Tissierella sp. MB52-C2]WMM26676.1 hypothetical protein RBU61_08355 [Tissierella sp. MB52-C2]
MFKNWSNRDWFWLMSTFLGFIIIILTWRLNDNDSVVNIISMFSSGASIILALVAIVQSTMYNNSANELNARITEKISVMENNVELIKNNVIKDVKEVIDNSSIREEEKEELKYNLKNVMQEKNFNEHSNISSLVYEKLIFNRLKNIYANDYKIEYEPRDFNRMVDIVLEGESKMVLIEVKVFSSQSMKNSIKKVSSRLKLLIEEKSCLYNKSLSGLIVVVSDNKLDYLEEIDDRICIVHFTKTEIAEVSDDVIKRKLMI